MLMGLEVIYYLYQVHNIIQIHNSVVWDWKDLQNIVSPI